MLSDVRRTEKLSKLYCQIFVSNSRFVKPIKRRKIPYLRHKSITLNPVSVFFSILMICFAENRFRFIVGHPVILSLIRKDSI